MTILSKKEGFTIREMGDDVLFLDPDGTSIHVADEVGGFIYRQIDGEKTLEDILNSILDEYDVDKRTAESDLLNFAESLVSQKIAEIM